MKYGVKYTSRFKKDYKRLKKRHRPASRCTSTVVAVGEEITPSTGCHSAISRARKPLALRHDNAPATGLFAFRHRRRESLYAPRIFAHLYLTLAMTLPFRHLPARTWPEAA